MKERFRALFRFRERMLIERANCPRFHEYLIAMKHKMQR